MNKAFLKIGGMTVAFVTAVFTLNTASAASIRSFTLASTSIATVSNSPSFVCSATFGDVQFSGSSVQQINGKLYINGQKNRKLVLTLDDLEGRGYYHMKIWLVSPNGDYSATGWVAFGNCHLQ